MSWSMTWAAALSTWPCSPATRMTTRSASPWNQRCADRRRRFRSGHLPIASILQVSHEDPAVHLPGRSGIHLLRQCRNLKESLTASEQPFPLIWYVPTVGRVKLPLSRTKFERLRRQACRSHSEADPGHPAGRRGKGLASGFGHPDRRVVTNSVHRAAFPGNPPGRAANGRSRT